MQKQKYLYECNQLLSHALSLHAIIHLANLGLGQFDAELTLEQTVAEGTFLLPPEQMQPGESWTINIESEFSFTQEEGGIFMEVAGDMTTEQQHQVLSRDPIVFDGQTVDGIQLEVVSIVNMIMNVVGSNIEQSFSSSSTYELGRGIGIVSQVSISDFGTETVELVSYFIP